MQPNRGSLPRVLLAIGLLLIVAAAPTKTPIVTVTKSDGTAVRGQLNSSDPKGISIVQLVKGQPTGESVTLTWADIKSVSNGLTQKRAIEQWKKDHPEDLCTDCHGSGAVICPTCKGTGRDATKAKDCPTCHGAQTIPCTTPKCDHGKIACPKLHLKLTEGTWYKKEDGAMWRKFPSRGGGFEEVSERHLGQIIETKDGIPGSPIDCPLCGGKMVIDDPKCHGAGVLPCNTCTNAANKEKCPDCKNGQVPCKTCKGTGLKTMADAAP
jgi:hypothetical protein